MELTQCEALHNGKRTMTNEQRVEELLVAWEEGRQGGEDISVVDLCSSDPELVEEVRERIEALERIYSVLNAPTDVPEDTVQIQSKDKWPSPHGYECVAFLGQGGASVVYKAWQPELTRFVALKIIREIGDSRPERVARFRSEAKAAQLQHPNIVRIHDVGDYEGSPYLALEYLNAGTLAQWTKGSPQDPRASAGLVRTLAEAVHYAHGRGIVHRDLKPANILFQSAGSGDVVPETTTCREPLWTEMTPKVVDFGIAKFLNENAGVTMTGDVMGTPAYMAPEQADGHTDDIGPPVDIHALGIILFELLTGRAPFAAPSILESLEQLRHRDAVPPSQIQPGLPADLENICLKCLQKDPAARYASANDLAADLERFLDGRPVSARPIGNLERLARWRRRNPLIASLSVSLAIAVVAGFALVTWKWAEADRARQVADENFAQVLNVIDDYLVIVGSDLLLNEPGMQPLREQLLTSALTYYSGFLQQHANNEDLRQETIDVRIKVAGIKRLLGDTGEARELLEDAHHEQVSLLRTRPDDAEYLLMLNRIENDLAGVLMDTGELVAGLEIVGNSVERAAQRTPALQASLARSEQYVGQIQQKLGDVDAAESAYQKSLQLLRRLRSDDQRHRRQLASCLILSGHLQMEVADHDSARAELVEAIDVASELVADEPDAWDTQLTLSDGHQALGKLNARQRNWQEAVASFTTSEFILRQLIQDHPQVIHLRLALCDRLLNFGTALQWAEPQQALEYQLEVLDLCDDLLRTHPGMPGVRSRVALAASNAGKLHVAMGQVVRATQYQQDAADALRELTDRWPDVVEYQDRLVTTQIAIAHSQFDAGAVKDSIETARTAVADAQTLVELAPRVSQYQLNRARALHTLASHLCAVGQTAEGLGVLNRSIAQMEQLTDGQPLATLGHRVQLAQYHLDSYTYSKDLRPKDEALLSLEKSRELVTELDVETSDDPASRFAVAKVYFALALAEQASGNPEEASQLGELALNLLQQLSDDYPRTISFLEWMARISNNLGNSYRLLGQTEQSQQHFQRCFDILMELNLPDAVTMSHRDTLARAHMNYGTLLTAQKQPDDAVAEFEKAIVLWESILESTELIDARLGLIAAYGNVGHAHWSRRNAEPALSQYNKGITHIEALLAAEPGHKGALRFRQNVHWGRARALNKLERYREAAEDWRTVRALSPEKSRTLFNVELGWSLAKSGDHAEAAKLAADVASESETEPAMMMNAARLAALAWGAVEVDDGLNAEEKDRLQTEYCAQCVEILSSLREEGYFDDGVRRTMQLSVSPEFLAMLACPEFTAFVASLTDASGQQQDPM